MQFQQRDNKYYRLLGVSETASADEIKRAFKKRALEEHPDKGGDAEVFKQLNIAHQVLTDPHKRQIYDQFGEEGLQNQQQEPQKQSEPVFVDLEFTLEDLYFNREIQFKINKSVLCVRCDGKGGEFGAVTQCQQCQGRGFTVATQMLAPGIVSQRQLTCGACTGSGNIINEQLQCKICEAKQVVFTTETLNLKLQNGMKTGQRVIIKGAGNQKPDAVPGDVVLNLVQQDHELFQKEGNDLIYVRKISLIQALAGVAFNINHLNGSIVKLFVPEGQIITPDSCFAAPDLGMPIGETSFGDLIVKFQVEFPKKISQTQLQQLKQVFDYKPYKQNNNVKLMAQLKPAQQKQTESFESFPRMDCQQQ